MSKPSEDQHPDLAERDAAIREKAREGGCHLEIYDDAHVDEVDDGYWVTAKLFVPKEPK